MKENNLWKCKDNRKVKEIREERMQNRIYPDSATTCAYIQSPSNPLEISTILVKSFTSNEPQRNPLLCVQ